MLTKPEIACAIIEGISSVREDEELQDFVVEVEGKEFKCHRLILSACSGFFRGLLRSGMKESQKLRTKLEGVSMETFTDILETLYTGCNNLTRDNVLNVWLASDQLQITVVFDNCVDFITNNICNETVISVWEIASQLMHKNIIELCTTFISNNTSLENWEIIYLTSNSLGSDLILSHVRDFIKKNYEHVINSETFLCLSETYLLEIINGQDLIVSTEDVVIESILNWVNNGSQIKSEITTEDKNEDVSSVLDVNEKDEHEQHGQDYNGQEEVKNEEDGHEYDGHEQDGHKQYEHDEDKQIKDEQTEDNLLISQDLLTGGHSDIFFNRSKYSKEASMKSLEILLSETRLCLVSSKTLEKLSRDPLVMDNIKTREMVMDAALYKSVGHQHGQWSKGAIHRSCSDLENVGMMGCLKGVFLALFCHPEFHWSIIPDCPYLSRCTTVKLIAYMTDVFAVGDIQEIKSRFCAFVQNEWRKVITLPGHGWLGVAVEEFIYLMNSFNQQIKRFNPRLGNCFLEDLICFPTQDKIEHICSFDVFILAFCSELVKYEDETAVHCLDTMSQTWTRLDNLEGSAKNMVSFRKEKHLYILQRSGNLWEICSDGCKSINLKLMVVLWNGNHNVNGAICYNDALFIHGQECFSGQLFPVSLFSKVTVNGNQGNWSNIVPAIIKKSIIDKT